MPPASVIDTYITELDAALRGPRRAKADLLTEARDSLIDAAEAFESAGADRAGAEREAVREFGSLNETVPGYQAELALTQGRHTALLVLFVFAAQPFIWDYAFRWVTDASTVDPRTGFQLANELVEKLGGMTIVVSLLAVLAYRTGMRRPAVRARLVRLTGVFALGVCVAFTTFAMALTVTSPKPSGLLLAINLMWTIVFVLVPIGVIAKSARRCLAMA